jgi:hypothetical protein
MSVDGTWVLALTTPVGRQLLTVTLADEGGVLTGTFEGLMGSGEIEDGRADDGRLSWTALVVLPTEERLGFTAVVDRDQMSGTVDLGQYGTTAFTGTKS